MRAANVTVLVGAALLFLVQPVIAKVLLPWFGGAPAVWTTCQLFFTCALLLGYGWSHGVVRRLSVRGQVLAQRGLVVAALAAVAATALWWGAPLVPSPALQPAADANPSLAVLKLVALAVGLPYLGLATTGPLVQAWRAREAGASVYRLYALSNLGSLVGLLGYPVLVEPWLPLSAQGALVALGLVGWAVALWRVSATVHAVAGEPPVAPAPPASSTAAAPYLPWVALAAAPSALLLAVTNHLTQEVAPVPFLWVAPLSLYLLSFVAAFESERWYPARWVLPALSVLALLAAAVRGSGLTASVSWGVPLFLALLFVACLAAHGELKLRRPPPEGLTGFYAALALGGALGSVFVGVVAPLIFTSYAELDLSLVASLALVTSALPAADLAGRLRRFGAVLVAVVVALLLGRGAAVEEQGVVTARRDFFGVVRVVLAGEGDDDDARLLMHGRTVHGAQQLAPARRGEPTTYYARESGVGKLLSAPRDTPWRVGVIGLGAGTVAAYGKAGDLFRFYDISPAVLELARSHFTFLSDSAAGSELVAGDARLQLEREAPQGFHVLVLDAFSSDAVPTHLLTAEAFAVYQRHLAEGGVLAVHLSNRTLELVPVAAKTAATKGFEGLVISRTPASPWALPSRWLLLASSRAQFERLGLAGAGAPPVLAPSTPVWTDAATSLWRVVKW